MSIMFTVETLNWEYMTVFVNDLRNVCHVISLSVTDVSIIEFLKNFIIDINYKIVIVFYFFSFFFL